MKQLRLILLASLSSLLCSCVIPIPVPKTETKRTAHFENFYAKIYYSDGVFYFVDRYDKKQMALPVSVLAKAPYAPDKPAFTVIMVEDVLEKVPDASIFDQMQPIRFQRHERYYTLGKEVRDNPNPIQKDELPLDWNEKIKRKQLIDSEQYAVFNIPDLQYVEMVNGSHVHKSHRNLHLIRSKEILPNGSYSAVFQLNPSYGKRLDIGFPVIGPDIMGGGTSVGITPGLSKQ